MTSPQRAEIVVAGHVCLDIIPAFPRVAEKLSSLLTPGRLVNVGPALISTGGAVSNTGIALHRLGSRVSLMGKVGSDLFGDAVLRLFQRHDVELTSGMIVADGERTSYSVVVAPPDIDRIFLHFPGANDTFGAADVDMEAIAGSRLFHFGYPPIMRRMFRDGGRELATLLARVNSEGLMTSLDMAYPDAESESGRVAWDDVLARALPHVDVFCPSVEEILFMLERARHDEMSRAGSLLAQIDVALLHGITNRLLAMGGAIVVLKLGERGLYMRTAADSARFGRLEKRGFSDGDASGWVGREMLVPAFRVDVAGTTGAGDCAVAGFLAALLRGLSPAEALHSAAAVGAFNVESTDATSGVPSWDAVTARVASGRKRLPTLPLEGWKWLEDEAVWIGPRDRSA